MIRCGKCKTDDKTITHAWLETSEGIIIDITGDQFGYRRDNLFFDIPVYVGMADSFHRLFICDELSEVDEKRFYEDEVNQLCFKSIMIWFRVFFRRSDNNLDD